MNERKKLKSSLTERVKKDMGQAGTLAMDIVIVILCLILLFGLWFAGTSFAEAGGMQYKASSFFYAMESGHYERVLEMSRTNRFQGKGKSTEYQEYYAVADYFEASFYYHMYEQAGDEARAEKWLEKREEAASQMGTLSAEQQKIEALLGQK